MGEELKAGLGGWGVKERIDEAFELADVEERGRPGRGSHLIPAAALRICNSSIRQSFWPLFFETPASSGFRTYPPSIRNIPAGRQCAPASAVLLPAEDHRSGVGSPRLRRRRLHPGAPAPPCRTR